MNGRIVIETERLRLREFTREDLDPLAALLADPVVMRFWPAPLTRDESSAALDNSLRMYVNRGYGRWGVELKATGEFIGRCGLAPQTIDGEEQIEVGYIIAASHWRNGYGSEAAVATRDWGFSRLDVDRLVSLILPENVASIGVAKRNGMRKVGTHLHGTRLHRVYAITRAEWSEAKGHPVTGGESAS